MRNLPKNVLGFEASGVITAGDYKKVVFPAMEKNMRDQKEIRALVFLGKKFKGMNFGAVVDDLMVGMKYFRRWRKVAIVTEKKWLIKTINAMRFLWPGQVKTYPDVELKKAVSWLKTNK